MEDSLFSDTLEESRRDYELREEEKILRNSRRDSYLSSSWPSKVFQIEHGNKFMSHKSDEDGDCIIQALCNVRGQPYESKEQIKLIRSRVADEVGKCIEDGDNHMMELILNGNKDGQRDHECRTDVFAKHIERIRTQGIMLEDPALQAIANLGMCRVIVHYLTVQTGDIVDLTFTPKLKEEQDPILFLFLGTVHLATHVEAITVMPMIDTATNHARIPSVVADEVSQTQEISIHLQHNEDRKRKRIEEDKQIRFQRSLLFCRFPRDREEANIFDIWNRFTKYSILGIYLCSTGQKCEFVSRELDEIEEKVIECYRTDWSKTKKKDQDVKYFYNENNVFFDLTCNHFERLIDDKGWLLSETINVFMFLLKSVSLKLFEHGNVHFFSSEFYESVKFFHFMNLFIFL